MFRKDILNVSLLLVILCLGGERLALSQTDAEAKLNFARIETSIAEGKLAEVEKSLMDYAISHPKDVRALELLAQLRYQQRRIDEAQALYQRVLALDASFVKAKINLAKLKFELGENEAARLMLAETATGFKLNVNERLALTKALILVGDFQRALLVSDSLPIAVKNGSGLPLRAAVYLGLRQQEKVNELAPLIRRASISEPGVAAESAEVFEKADMPREAVAILRFTLARAPGNYRLLVLLGRIETKLGELAEARRHLNSALKLKSPTFESSFALGLLEAAEQSYAKAVLNLEQAHSLAPDSVSVLQELTVNAMRANQPLVAVNAAEELLRLKPDDPESLYLLGAASLQKGSLASARSVLERYRQKRPDDPRGCLALGITLATQPGQSTPAKSEFEQCLKLDPANVEAKYQLGLIFKSEGETERAVQLLEEVIARTPEHASALRDVGALYLQTGADVKARNVLEKAATLNPADAETHFLLSRLYSRVGDSALAKQHLDQFQKIKSQREKPTSQ
jgi:tetratricopeptide (TPR) repeat protein